MSDEKLRLGGMALRNGLALFGPTSWAAAVRTADGGIRVGERPRPRFRAADRVPLARGVVRMSEMLAALPVIRRRLPDARLSFEHGSVAASRRAVRGARRRRASRRGGFRGELGSDADRHRPVARHAAQPRARALPRRRAQDRRPATSAASSRPTRPRSTSAAARTSSRRCCSARLVPPASLPRAPRGLRRPVGALGSLAAIGFAFELFAWRERHPALARRPRARAARARRCSAPSRRPSPARPSSRWPSARSTRCSRRRRAEPRA